MVTKISNKVLLDLVLGWMLCTGLRYSIVLQGDTKSMREKRQQATKKVDATAKDLKNSTHVFSRSLKQSPLTPDNLEKVQSDRYRRCFIALCIPMRRILTCKMCVSVQKRHNICVVVIMC